MRGRSWRLGRIVVAVAFVAVAAVLVGTFTASRSASHAPFVFTKGDPEQLDQDQGRESRTKGRTAHSCRPGRGAPARLPGGRHPVPGAVNAGTRWPPQLGKSNKGKQGRAVDRTESANYPGVLSSRAALTTQRRVASPAWRLTLELLAGELPCLGAAGGGVWRTDNATCRAARTWDFVSGVFDTNAIGTLVVDRRIPR